ncbi:MAG TPA: hypothetical protein VGQ58_03205, partial [Candidatus Limnocylindrales bacterium]|nr:hypothetical protein [Candidatus Limnocylindrales bacterium]
MTVKEAVLVPVPPGVVTLIGPVLAPAGTVALSEPYTTLPKEALTPLNLTAVAPVKAEPLMVTLVPTGPPVGAKLSRVGLTLKLVALVPVPPGVVTLSLPVVAPPGTEVAIVLSFVTLKLAPVPLNLTAVAPLKPEPLTVTLFPTGPDVGVKLETTGTAASADAGASAAQPTARKTMNRFIV